MLKEQRLAVLSPMAPENCFFVLIHAPVLALPGVSDPVEADK